MRLAKTAKKAFDQFSAAESKVAQIHKECGALLARPFVASGLHRVIESETDASVAFEKLAALLADEKEKAAFRNEVNRRALSQTATKQRKKRIGKGEKVSASGVAA